jgi:hypothetical protein
MAGNGLVFHALHVTLAGETDQGHGATETPSHPTYVARHSLLGTGIVWPPAHENNQTRTLTWRSDRHRCLDVDVFQPLQFLHPRRLESGNL